MTDETRRQGMSEMPALPLAQSAYDTFEDWVAAIREVADHTFLDRGYGDRFDVSTGQSLGGTGGG